ncbi:AzlC family ABC transporter permease [Lawsonibacter celer]|jgi:4-azaleucine resistance transporter AzlC|uniref:AzlC family ABC transporter permease n=1 Tax=Lawsonibacter celer TaxID=2986526 RepID=UPI0016496491|nr:AzlC family ABC transporter permease [Lawsonibacter celer]
MDRKALAAAFPVTVPVLMGYLSIGIAFGLMLERIGYNFIWAFFMSLTIYAGSGQYLGVSLLETAATLGTVALMTFLINFRHLVYGLSMLEKFRGMGIRKLYMIFSLTDETYALLASAQAPVGVNPKDFYFAIALLDHAYWILGSVIGAVAGALLPIDITGIDFAMTALFVVIAVDQWKAYKKHFPAVLGGAVTVLFLIVLGYFFGQQQMLLISLGVIVLVLLIFRDKLEETPAAEGEEGAPC